MSDGIEPEPTATSVWLLFCFGVAPAEVRSRVSMSISMRKVRPAEREAGFGATLIVSAAVFCCGFSFALADSDFSNSKEIEGARQKVYIEKLEARIRNLEKKEDRLRVLEKKIETLNSRLASRDPGHNGWFPSVSGRGSAAAKPNNSVAATENPPPAAQQANAAAPPTQAALAEKEDVDALRDLTVIRDQAVTVKQGGVDVGFNFKYLRTSTNLQFSRAFISTGSIRYGILPGVETSLTVPAYMANRRTQIGPGTEFTTDIKSMGDISGQVTASLFKETLDWPGVFGYVAVTAPTGPDPYWVEPGLKPYAQPINPLYFTQSSGHWNGTIGATFVKTLEPIILFGGLSYTHYLRRDVAGSLIQPSDRFGYNFGLGLAVSERTMIGASVQGIYQKNIVVDGTPAMGTSSESVILNLSLSQRISMGFFFEPSVSIGMTSDAPSAAITIGARKSF